MAAVDQSTALRIFIVEDHSDSRAALTGYLTDCGHMVRHARSIADTVATLEITRCDLLLSDIGLPDGDGWELLEQLREKGRSPNYAIAMSGFCSLKDRRKSLAAGYRQHLAKPLDPDRLDAAIAEAQREKAAASAAT